VSDIMTELRNVHSVACFPTKIFNIKPYVLQFCTRNATGFQSLKRRKSVGGQDCALLKVHYVPLP
jgi:hypothetical protein